LPQITTPAQLEPLAHQLYERFERSHRPAETHLHLGDTHYQIILRAGPVHSIQLVAVGWGRYWPLAWRESLLIAFGVPDEVRQHPDHNLLKGWQILKWTWQRPQVLQLSFALVVTEETESHYKVDR